MALQISVTVVPSSGKTGCVFNKQQRLKCYLKSAAEKGKANDELIYFFARLCGVPQRDVEIITGFTFRTKLLLIKTTMTYEQLLQALGLEKQQALF